jgi:hypothetical protein
VRILAFSDLHRDERDGRLLVERSRRVDVVAGVGDFASMHRGLEGMIDVLSAIDRPVLLVPGNNETDGALRAACAGWPVARVVHGEVTEIDDVTFFGLGGGVPVTPWDWSFDLTEQQAERMLTGLSPGLSCWFTRHRRGTSTADSAAQRCCARSSSGVPDSCSAATCTSAGARRAAWATCRCATSAPAAP